MSCTCRPSAECPEHLGLVGMEIPAPPVPNPLCEVVDVDGVVLGSFPIVIVHHDPDDETGA